MSKYNELIQIKYLGVFLTKEALIELLDTSILKQGEFAIAVYRMYTILLIGTSASYKIVYDEGDDTTLKSDGHIPMINSYFPEFDNDIVTKKYVDDNIKSIPQLIVKIVDSLPEIGEILTIYFLTVPSEDNLNNYEEWMWIDNSWERIGSTTIDISTKEDIKNKVQNVEPSTTNYPSTSAVRDYITQQLQITNNALISLINSSKQLKEQLTVAGVTVGNLTSGKVFNAGTDIEYILRTMLIKELFPTRTLPSLNIISTPVAMIDECGTNIQSIQVDLLFNPGLYNNNGWTTPVQPEYGSTGVAVTSSATLNFNNKQYNVTLTNNIGSVQLQQNIILVEGIMPLTSSVTYSGSTNVPISNLSNPVSSINIPSGTATSNIINFIGYRRYWYGSKNIITSFPDSASVRNLGTTTSNSGLNCTKTTVITISMNIGDKQAYIIFPVSVGLIKDVKSAANSGNSILASITKLSNTNVEGLYSFASIPYNVYVYNAPDGILGTDILTITLK